MALRKGLEALDGVKSIKRSKTRDGGVSLSIRPKNSGLIATDVAAVIRSKKIPVREMFVDRGTLDDVFRKITMPQKPGQKSAKKSAKKSGGGNPDA